MPPVSPNFPSLETCLNTLRAICNDSFAGATSTPGEGQILTDVLPGGNTNNPFVLNLLNSAIRELYREIRIAGASSVIQDNYLLLDIPPVNGPLGPSVPDSTVETYFDGVNGYWDGSTFHPNLVTPPDMLMPIRLWERSAGTTDTFREMIQNTNGLAPREQLDRFQDWEWRYERIITCGALQSRDLRLRYQAVMPQFFTQPMTFASTFIPVIDSEDYVAYKTAEKVSLALGRPDITAALKGESDRQIFQLKNERARRKQQINYLRRAYNDSDTAQDLDAYGI